MDVQNELCDSYNFVNFFKSSMLILNHFVYIHKTGIKPQYKTAVAVALKVIAGTKTFFPF